MQCVVVDKKSCDLPPNLRLHRMYFAGYVQQFPTKTFAHVSIFNCLDTARNEMNSEDFEPKCIRKPKILYFTFQGSHNNAYNFSFFLFAKSYLKDQFLYPDKRKCKSVPTNFPSNSTQTSFKTLHTILFAYVTLYGHFSILCLRNKEFMKFHDAVKPKKVRKQYFVNTVVHSIKRLRCVY